MRCRTRRWCDVTTSDGVVGHAYLFCYTPMVLPALTSLVEELGAAVVGTPAAPRGVEADLAVDYNQTLPVPKAIRRINALADEDLLWVEEPTRADDAAGHARIRAAVATPIQLGESWWGADEMTASITAGAGDHAMLDVARIGGVTGWLRAAALAHAAGLPLSSHFWPEISAALLTVSASAFLLEYLDGRHGRGPVRDRAARPATHPIGGAVPAATVPRAGKACRGRIAKPQLSVTPVGAL